MMTEPNQIHMPSTKPKLSKQMQKIERIYGKEYGNATPKETAERLRKRGAFGLLKFMGLENE